MDYRDGLLKAYLSEQIGGECDHFRFVVVRLGGCEISNAFECELLLAHYLENIERRPFHIVPEHLQL